MQISRGADVLELLASGLVLDHGVLEYLIALVDLVSRICICECQLIEIERKFMAMTGARLPVLLLGLDSQLVIQLLATEDC